MANIEKAFTSEDGISLGLNDDVGIFTSPNDPSIGVGETAPIGSLLLRSNGEAYLKTGPSDTDWDNMAASSGEAKAQFYHHNGAVEQIFSIPTILLFGTALRADANFTYNANGSITINTSGWYRITYDVSITATTNKQLASQTEILLNGSPIVGSIGHGEHRDVVSGLQTISGTAIVNIAATDNIEIQVTRISGTTNLTSIANACRLNIRAI